MTHYNTPTDALTLIDGTPSIILGWPIRATHAPSFADAVGVAGDSGSIRNSSSIPSHPLHGGALPLPTGKCALLDGALPLPGDEMTRGT